MKIRPKYNVWFLRRTNIDGITIYPFIFFKPKKEDVSDELFRHELEHIYQVNRLGWFRFYLTYLWQNIRHGYRNNPYEKEAYAIQNQPLTAYEQRLKQ